MFKKLLRFLGIVWQWIGGIALLLVILFLSIKNPYERLYESPKFRKETDFSDGPFVFRVKPSQLKFITSQDDPQKSGFQISEQLVDLEEGARILSAMGQSLEDPSLPAALPSSFQTEQIAVVGDIHGKYRHLILLLQNNNIVDQELNWIWKANQLVILGDVFDKGPEVTRCLWLIRKLEAQAEKENGRVYYLFGNHDHLALNGKSRTNHYKYTLLAERLGVGSDSLFNKNSLLGQWIRNRNLIVKINDRLFMHAGLSERLLNRRLALERMNHLARQSFDPDRLPELSSEDRAICGDIWGPEGPVWFRGYYDSSFPFGFLGKLRKDLREAEGVESLLDRTLQQYGCRQIVVGHLPSKQIRTLYHNKLIVTCPDLPYNDIPAAVPEGELLLIEKEQAFRAGCDGKKQRL